MLSQEQKETLVDNVINGPAGIVLLIFLCISALVGVCLVMDFKKTGMILAAAESGKISVTVALDQKVTVEKK